ncbi:MAG: nucleotide sugar dehydrogenase [Alphaproteobacteria bacterium]
MKVCVYGLWHLGSVTAACLPRYGVDTVGLDNDAATIGNLSKAVPPLHEPGLPELVDEGLKSGKLRFTTDAKSAVSDADVVWVAIDTPVNDDDVADVGYVEAGIARDIFPYLKSGAVVLVSSQMPVGSMAKLEQAFAKVANGRQVEFACSPENLRLGKAIGVFTNPGRIIVGVRGDVARARLEPLLKPICDTIFWIGVESAEMTKHALNAFLATSITFANEIATICERVGADSSEVEKAIQSDPRIGTQSYVRAGFGFGGGTLARDVRYLEQAAEKQDVKLRVLGSVLDSNEAHRHWAFNRLTNLLGGLKGKRIALLGLSYKPGTDAIRRSVAVDLIRLLTGAGAIITAFDPKVKSLPSDLKATVAGSAQDALKGADAAIIATEWPDFRELSADDFKGMARTLVLDQSRFLNAQLSGKLEYVTTGRSA